MPINEVRTWRQVTGQERAELSTDYVSQYQAGKSIRAIAAASGRSYGFVHRILSDAAAPMRSRGGARPPGGWSAPSPASPTDQPDAK